MDNNILDQDELQAEVLPFAGFWDRFFASLIDGLIFIPVSGLAFYNGMKLQSLPLALVLGVLFIIYKIYMEGTKGATIGKRTMGIHVVTTDYTPINSNISVQRNILFALNSLTGLVSTIMVFKAIKGFEGSSIMDMLSYQNEYGFQLDAIMGIIVFISGLWIAFDKQKQGLHDKIGKTYVVKG